ncbi:hypothetical protein ASD40_31485 [Paenibacillus sp. Root444D2]|nr:hypothetical protein ASD40_31485 [Paenibacillus sp. Root444D2]
MICYITIFNGNIRIQRVEGGGQINKNVGTNANQGGQSAKKINHKEIRMLSSIQNKSWLKLTNVKVEDCRCGNLFAFQHTVVELTNIPLQQYSIWSILCL